MKTSRTIASMKTSGALALALSLILFLFGCASDSSKGGSADSYPDRQVQLIVPFAAGGPTDSLARALAEAVESPLGQPMVVVNRPGAGGATAATEVANAQADGYTVFMPTRATMSAQPALRTVEYSIDDFRGITGLVEQPYVLVVGADSPWQTLDDLANSNERVVYGHPAVGGFPHIAQAAFFGQAGVQAEAVPFEGNEPALQALLGGQIQALAVEPSEAIPQIDAGEIIPLAVTSPERLDILPDVPSFEEAGYDQATFVQSWSLLVASGTPDENVEVLQNAVSEAVESPEYQNFIEDNYMAPNLISGEEVIENMKSEQERIAQLYEELDIQAA
jgi:putative tricarboxylic transport membrane protein